MFGREFGFKRSFPPFPKVGDTRTFLNRKWNDLACAFKACPGFEGLGHTEIHRYFLRTSLGPEDHSLNSVPQQTFVFWFVIA